MNPGWRGERFYRGVIDVPTLLIVAGAIGLWHLWPDADAVEAQAIRRMPDEMRVELMSSEEGEKRLHLSPDLFGRPSKVGFGHTDASGVSATTEFTGRPASAPRFLAAAAQTSLTNLPAVSESLSVLAETHLGGHRLLWPSDPVFREPAESRGPKIVPEISGVLAGRGFEVAEWPEGLMALSEKPWAVTLSVLVDARGRTEQVFVETGSGQSAIDLLVVKAVERGRAITGEASSAGRIAVNFGGR